MNRFRFLAPLLISLSLALSTVSAQAVDAPVISPATPWWQHAVIYEIYPRSFADSNGDGVGDLNGITSKLDYLKDLGVDALWITPCFPSPQVDFGYDISDYCNIAPEYGTLADFDRLVAEAKKRNIRIVLDFVINHTSDKHPWFVQSRSSLKNPKRDWYIWRDGKSPGNPPNNWQSLFGHSAWALDAKTNQYYYHFFYPQQPDLNWRNPDVRKAMYDVMRFWMDRGVAGFRLDAVGCMFEDPALKDNPVAPGTNAYGDPNMINVYNDHLPEVHDVLRQMRQVMNSYPGNRVLIGETSGKDIADVCTMYGAKLDEIQLPMNFFFAFINKLSPKDFRDRIAEWDNNPSKGWPVYLFSNHDQIRHYVRYGDGVHNDDIAKMMATLLLTMRGTPLLYYGEEIGMENNDPKRKEDVFDPIGKIGWPKEKGRDGERTPMQWNTSEFAGFSTHKPWLASPASYSSHNVASESSDPSSILNFYKHLIDLRRNNKALREGSLELLDPDNDKVLAYLRKTANDRTMIVMNMSGVPQDFTPKFNGEAIAINKLGPLLDSNLSMCATNSSIKLLPYQTIVLSVQK
ncbi:MAG TPA: alpha-glucosidase [Planktothrix sp.]